MFSRKVWVFALEKSLFLSAFWQIVMVREGGFSSGQINAAGTRLLGDKNLRLILEC